MMMMMMTMMTMTMTTTTTTTTTTTMMMMMTMMAVKPVHVRCVCAAQRHMSSRYSADPIQRLPAPLPSVATLGASEVVESELDRAGINLLWIVAPICATIVLILLLALIVVVAIR